MSAGRVPFFGLSLFCSGGSVKSLEGNGWGEGGTYMENEDGELGVLAAETLAGDLDILLELADGVVEGGAGVVDLVDDQDALADQVAHLAERGQVEPLGAGDLSARGLDDRVGAGGGELLVEREADGLDGDVGVAGALEEGAQDTSGNVAAAADGDHELRVEGLEDLGSDLLAELVDLLHFRDPLVRCSAVVGAARCRLPLFAPRRMKGTVRRPGAQEYVRHCR